MRFLRPALFLVAALASTSAALAGGWSRPGYYRPVWSEPSRVLVVETIPAPVYEVYPALVYPWPLYRPIMYNHPPRLAIIPIDTPTVRVWRRPRMRRRVIVRRAPICRRPVRR
ncbi:MAG TPA: hypothetical protein VND97_01310 [Beijerinckiaceae bacterium]|nr:hypothetical protein [Beijerinckiaceae bacterium]